MILNLWFHTTLETHKPFEHSPAIPCNIIELTLKSQEEVDSFSVKYALCDQINGNLKISGNIKNLDSLYGVTGLRGTLAIEYCDSLESLHGLSNLKSIIGELEISNNKLLKSMAGLDSLKTISGGIALFDNSLLESLNGLEQLTFRPLRNIVIQSCPKLSICNYPWICSYIANGGSSKFENNAPGCSNIFEVTKACNPGMVCPNGFLYFSTQKEINDFKISFPNCQNVNGPIWVELSSEDSANLEGLSNIRTVRDYMAIYGNHGIRNLDGLDSLTSIGQFLIIQSNSKLTSLAGLNALKSTDIISIEGNKALTNIDDLNPVNLKDFLYIQECPALSACHSNFVCSYLAKGGQSLIRNNAPGCFDKFQILKSCDTTLTCPPGDILIQSTNEVKRFKELYPHCTDINGSLLLKPFDSNFYIESLEELSQIRSVSGTIEIYNNAFLKDLKGLDSIHTIGGDIHIEYNLSLKSLSGFPALRNFKGDISIVGNDSLTDISHLNHLDTAKITNLDISYNLQLSTCDIDLVCTYLSSDKPSIIIDNNKGCLTAQEVIFNCKANHCIGTPIILTSQAQVDSFPIDYQGCINFTSITIHGEDIKNLDSLWPVTTVQENLIIHNNPRLEHVDGLSHLMSVHGSLIIDSNTVLANLKGLEKLTSVDDTLSISYQPALIDLRGLEKLLSISSALEIRGNNILEDLSGLENLIILRDGLYIENNESLRSLLGLIALDRFSGSIFISHNDRLTDISSIYNVDTSFIDHLDISFNSSLITCEINLVCKYLSGAKPSNIIGNQVGCRTANEVLTNCKLRDCASAYIILTSQAQVDRFPVDYSGCTGFGSIIVSGLDIQNVDSLQSILSIEGDLIIQNNPLLESLEGLSNLSQLKGNLLIDTNAVLTNLEGIALSAIPGRVSISNNPLLTDLTDLSALKSITGTLEIHSNALLMNLHGLDSLITIINGVSIHHNSSLKSLDGLSALIFLGGDLRISHNDSLTDISSLDQLDELPINHVDISFNPLLAICEIDLVCRYLSSGKPSNISDNLIGCSSLTEVLRRCTSKFCGGATASPILLTSQAQVNRFPIDYKGCTTFSGITISGPDIVNLDSLGSIVVVLGDVRIQNNPMLTSIEGLTGLFQIQGSIAIDSNAMLTNLKGLQGLTLLSAGLSITNNPLLNDIQAISNVRPDGITSISLQHNPKLAICSVKLLCNYLIDTNHVAHINDNANTCNSRDEILLSCKPINCPTGVILITRQVEIDSFKYTYANCTHIPGHMIIFGPNIVNLEGLSVVTSIDGQLDIQKTSLKSLHGLEQLDYRSIDGLILVQNDSLSICEIEPICNFLLDTTFFRDIQKNAPNCNSELAIREACDTASNSSLHTFSSFQHGEVRNLKQGNIKLFPNPTTGIISINNFGRHPITRIEVKDIVGRTIQDIRDHFDHKIDLTRQRSGIYIITISTPESQWISKVVKQ